MTAWLCTGLTILAMAASPLLTHLNPNARQLREILRRRP